MIVRPATTAEPIKMLFGLWTWVVGSRKHVSDEGAHWRRVENTIKSSMCGGDAAFFVTLLRPLVVILLSLRLQLVTIT